MLKSTFECFGLSVSSKINTSNSHAAKRAGVLHVLLLTCVALIGTASWSVAGPMEVPTNARLLITGTNQASVMWVDTSTGETGYEIQRRTGDAGSWTLVQSPAANATSWTDTAVPASNFVYYRVRTKNGTFASGWSNVACLTNPGDSDADGIPDATETAAGLDPSDWKDATADLDGDGVPNLWEYVLSTDMTNDASKPAPAVTVDPSVVTESATVKRTITNAVNALSSLPASPNYHVIVVMPGVYEENVTLPAARKIALLSDGSGTPPEIRGYSPYGSKSQVVEILGDAVVDGFRITRKAGDRGFGVYAFPNSHRGLVRIVNCAIHGHQWPTVGQGTTTGIEQKLGRLVVSHSTIYGNNRNSGQGAGLYSSTTHSEQHAVSINSIYWNVPSGTTSEISHNGTATFVNCIVRNGSAWGAVTSDPLINPQGYLTASSPAIGAGAAGHGAPWDIDVEVRDANSDIGFDEFIDADADGIPDHYETGGNLLPGSDDDGDGVNNLDEHAIYGTSPIETDSDGDGLSDGDEITAGTNPHITDSDDDGMPDGYEVLHGLDPLSLWDRLGDVDGDRIPNIWEYKRGTSPSNAASKPATDWIVDPSLAGTGIYKATIQLAINAVTTAGYYAVIEVRPGAYAENVVTPSTRGILLLADQQAPPVEIRAPESNYGVRFGGEAVIDGFRITRADNVSEVNWPGLLVDVDYELVGLPRAQAKVVNCFINGHTRTDGAGIQITKARVTVEHCTITGNSASNQGNGIYVGGNSLNLVNSIVWNPAGSSATQVYLAGTGQVIATGSIIYGGEHGAANVDPLLNPKGFPTAASPAVDAGTAGYSPKDYQGEVRVGAADIGADEFVDSDSDGLPDWVEALGAVSPSGDLDSDGLSNLDEYAVYATLVNVADTDGDGLNDGGEAIAGTNPHDLDTDDDGMSDGFEVTNGINPTDYRDALDDKDGDRFPNIYEWANGSDLNSALSTPSVHCTVDPAATVTPTVKNTISLAITTVNGLTGNYKIVLVKSGTYDEYVQVLSKSILLLGDSAGNAPRIIRSAATPCFQARQPQVCIDRFVMSHQSGVSERAVHVLLPDNRSHVRLVNCLLTKNTFVNGPGMRIERGRVTVDFCTIINNITSSYISGPAGILVESTGTLRLRNSVVWNREDATVVQQISETTAGTVEVAGSIILGGEFGASSANPLIDRATSYLTSASPAVDSAVALPGSLVLRDIDGELRDAYPDIGADECFDSDNDGLPDLWEQEYYGSLTWTGNDDTDGDGLANGYEGVLGLSPNLTDSDGDGVTDWVEALGAAASFYNALSDLADDDADGLTNAQEAIIGSNSSSADSNGDGVRDGASWRIGINPTLTDSDGDGVSNAIELAQGTNPLLADTDKDGVPDATDAFPLDPGASSLSAMPGDTTAPSIILTKPPGATLIP